MIRLIENIFTENKFELRYLGPANSIILASDSKKASYYLVVFLEGPEFDEINVDQLNDYYDIVKGMEEGYEPQMDKNLSMLICVNSTTLGFANSLNKLIFDIEEDPYLFKKYVLTYTNVQLEMALQGKKGKSIMMYLHAILNDESAFQEHKKSPDNESEYNLVSKLFIKLPFLNLTKMNREIANLKESITNSLDPELLNLRNDLLHLKYVANSNDTDSEENDTVDEETLRKRLIEYVGVDING